MTFRICQTCGANFVGDGWGPTYCGPCLEAIREGLRRGPASPVNIETIDLGANVYRDWAKPGKPEVKHEA